MDDDGLLRVVMGNSHLYSHPMVAEHWGRLTTKDARALPPGCPRDSLMAHGVEPGFIGMPALASVWHRRW
jgi:hypothetical protein